MSMLSILTLLVDFGLMILVWMTQLVVYPSFNYFRQNDLMAWHIKYTTNVSVLVAPLMAGQGILHGLHLFIETSVWSILGAILVILMLINTFFVAVPLHNKIGAGLEVEKSVRSLVKVNKFRSIGWSMTFVISLLQTVI
jgi:hypothetical protein